VYILHRYILDLLVEIIRRTKALSTLATTVAEFALDSQKTATVAEFGDNSFRRL